MPELYAVTSGDPAGIGPDISLKIALREDNHQFVVFGNIDLLRERAEMHAMDIKFIKFNDFVNQLDFADVSRVIKVRVLNEIIGPLNFI